MATRTRRSVLYMPASNARALEKAKTLAADALIFDLEDSVAPEAKVEARAALGHTMAAGGFGKRERIIRINGLDTPWGKDDMAAANALAPDAILIPKVSTAADVLKAAGLAGGIPIWVMIETPLAILNLKEIAAAGHCLRCFVLGCNDLLKDSRMTSRAALLPALAMAVFAARSFGLDCLDGVYNDLKDDAGFAAECEHGVMLGMDGKTLIHPGQIETCNRIFSPSGDQVLWALKIVAAFAEPVNMAKGVITLEGRMVERLHLAMAERVLAVST